MAINEFSVRVYIEDTDAGGIVYHANYLKYMERARSDFMRDLGYVHTTAEKQGYIFVVSELSIKYLSPALMDDELLVDVQVTSLKKLSMVLSQTIRHKQTGKIISLAQVKVVSVSSQSKLPVKMPELIHNKLKCLLLAS